LRYYDDHGLTRVHTLGLKVIIRCFWEKRYLNFKLILFILIDWVGLLINWKVFFTYWVSITNANELPFIHNKVVSPKGFSFRLTR